MTLARLSQCFPPHRVTWRVGSTTKDKTKGMALAYIDARDVMERLDDVCGPDGWQNRYTHAGSKTCCEIGIRIRGEWVWKSDGAGDTDYEGDKGAFSDAFKRSAVRWGIGRYLYTLGNAWEEIEQRGKSYFFTKKALERLAETLPKGALHGPLGVTELKTAMKEFAKDLAACDDESSLLGLLNTDETQSILSQCARDLPSWYYGQEGTDVRGAAERIEEKRSELNSTEEAA